MTIKYLFACLYLSIYLCLRSAEDAKLFRSLRRQLEEKTDVIDRLHSEIQQLVDRINSMETQHSDELGTFHRYK